MFYVLGIEIDRRHLSLLADFMCIDGVPKGCNRHAIQWCSSPLQQMTFETSCNFITRAAAHGECLICVQTYIINLPQFLH